MSPRTISCRFAWYRIVFGGMVLATAWGGWVTWAV
jgi:undecaprenyl-diphosphatase